MARVTVEDCLDKVDNRFELVMLGCKRARQLAVDGKPALVDEENDKATVIALREIAEGLITSDFLKEVEQEVDFEEEITIDTEGVISASMSE